MRVKLGSPVKWWGNAGQLARPYLWKANPTDTEYKEAWSDPRTPEPEQTALSTSNASNQTQSANSISKAAKSATDTTAEVASTLGGIFDISSNLSSDETAEESEFRRLMQRKKKRRRRI